MKGRTRGLILGRTKKFYWNDWEESRQKATVIGMLWTGPLPSTKPKPYRLSRIASPLKMGPTGYPETSLTKHEPRCVTSRKNEGLNCTAAGAWYHSYF